MRMAWMQIINIWPTAADLQIVDLQSPFMLGNYMEAGASTGNVAWGQSERPSGVVGQVYPLSSTTHYYTPVFQATNLVPNSPYVLYGWARATNGLYYPAGAVSFSTPEDITILVPTNGYGVTTTTTIDFYWTNPETYDSMYYSFWKGSTLVDSGYIATSTHKGFGALSPGTEYTFKIGGIKSSILGNPLSIVETTDYALGVNPPSDGYGDVGATSITFHWTNNSAYTNMYYLFIAYDPVEFIEGVFTGSAITQKEFTGLDTNRLYEFRLAGLVGSTFSAWHSIWAATVQTRPALWTAFSDLYSGQPMATRNNVPAPVTATLWNQFTAHINVVRVYKGLSSYTFSSVSQDDDIDASIISEAIDAIDLMNPPTSTPSDPVQDVTPVQDHFFDLQSSVNSVT